MKIKIFTAMAALLLCTAALSAQGVDCGKGNNFKNHGKANPSCGQGSGNTGGSGGQGGQGGQGGSSTSSVGNVGSYSGVSNSGNSSNTNVNVAEGGTAVQGQKQQQGQVQGQVQSNSSTNSNTATNQGNNSALNSTQSTAFNQVRQTASAIAPDTFPTSPCFKTASGAGQGAGFGFSLSGGKIDQGCDARETARILAAIGSKTAACKLLVSTKASKKAGVSLADCLKD